MSRARHKMEKHHKAGGGRVGMKAAGNPDVFKEAEGEEDYAKGDERKHGGKVKKKMKMMHAEGEKSKHRMDKPKRAKGGKVSSDMHPFSSAKAVHKAADMADGEPD
jgi:hypothetical protein